MTMMGKATEKGLEEVTKAVLGPHFHAEGVAPKKVRHPSSATPSPGYMLQQLRSYAHNISAVTVLLAVAQGE